MEINFYKIQIGGNDLLLVNQINKKIDKPDMFPTFVRNICKRSKGVGANGVIFLYKGTEHPVKMIFYNSRGYNSNISYDAILCSAKYVFDYGLAGSEYIAIETDFGIFTVDCIDSSNFRISLGEPETEDGWALKENIDYDFSKELIIEGRSITYTPVTLKDTGISIFVSTKQKHDKKEISNFFNIFFKNKQYRTVFIKIFNNEQIELETFSYYYSRDNCFISAVAGVASVLNGLCDRELTIYYKLDTLFFQWDKETNHVYITGQPSYVFYGSYYYEQIT